MECKHNRKFSCQISSVSASEYSETTTKNKDAISAIIIGAEKEKHRLSSGFTLLEMLVVIGIVALITSWAVPGIKKAYEDFKFRQTFDELNTIVSSFRAFYLIQGEFPEDSGNNYVKTYYAWCLPSNYYTRTLKNSEYQLNVKPYKATSYDVDNWFGNPEKSFFISIYKHTEANGWFPRLQENYPFFVVYKTNGGSACLGFPEVVQIYVTDSTAFRNRYY